MTTFRLLLYSLQAATTAIAYALAGLAGRWLWDRRGGRP